MGKINNHIDVTGEVEEKGQPCIWQTQHQQTQTDC